MFDSCEWEKKKRKHKRYRLNWRILIAKPEHRSKHVYKLNEASKVTLMSIDIPQCKLPSSSQVTEVSLKFKPSHVFLVNSKESYLYLLWYIKIWSVVAFLFIFQIASAYSIYQQSQSIKVYKHIEENADEISKDLPFSKKHLLGITVYFCLVPKNQLERSCG